MTNYLQPTSLLGPTVALFLISMLLCVKLTLGKYSAICGTSDRSNGLIFSNVSNLFAANDILSVMTTAPSVTAIQLMENTTWLLTIDQCKHSYTRDKLLDGHTNIVQGKESDYTSISSDFTYCEDAFECNEYKVPANSKVFKNVNALFVTIKGYRYSHTYCNYQLALEAGDVLQSGVLSTSSIFEYNSITVAINIPTKVDQYLYSIFDKEGSETRFYSSYRAAELFATNFLISRKTQKTHVISMAEEILATNGASYTIPIGNIQLPTIITVYNKTTPVQRLSQLALKIDISTVGCDDDCNIVTTTTLPENVPITLNCNGIKLRSRSYNSILSLSLSELLLSCAQFVPITCRSCSITNRKTIATTDSIITAKIPILGVNPTGNPIVVPQSTNGEPYGVSAGITVAVFVILLCICSCCTIFCLVITKDEKKLANTGASNKKGLAGSEETMMIENGGML